MTRKLTVPQQLQIYFHYRQTIIHDKDTEHRQSDQRVAFFLTLVTVVFGVITNLVSKAQPSDDLTSIFLGGGLVLLLYGLLTFAGVVWRSRNIAQHNAALRKIEKNIEDFDASVAKAIRPPDPSTVDDKSIDKLQGTYVQYLSIAESLIAWGCSTLLAERFGLSWPLSAMYTAPVAVSTLAGLLYWSKRMRKKPLPP